jgi:NlpC/P60 family
MAAAIVGGTAAELGGGKFANGAITGAFSRMFNDDGGKNIKDLRRKIIEKGEGWIGVKYKWGGNNANGIDCSHLVNLVYEEVGLQYSYASTGGLRTNAKFSIVSEPASGDLILFSGHVGIYNATPPTPGDTLLSATSNGVRYENPKYWGEPVAYLRHNGLQE